MALYLDAEVDPAAQTAFAREVPPDPAYDFLARLFPLQSVADNEVSWTSRVRTRRTAKFRAWDGRLHVSERDGLGGGKVQLAPLSTSFNRGEYEALQIYFAKFGGTNKSLLVDAIYDDTQHGIEEIYARLELAASDAAQDGKFTLNEGGLRGIQADYGWDPDQTQATVKDWIIDPTAPIASDLRSLVTDYRRINSGANPGGMWVSSDVAGAFALNAELRDLAYYNAGAGGTPDFLTDERVQQALRAYRLPPITNIYDVTVDVDGVETSVWPRNKVLLTPANESSVGFTPVGITATSLELLGSKKIEFGFEDAAGFVAVVSKEGPPSRQFVFVDAAAMPVFKNANSLMTVTVGAP